MKDKVCEKCGLLLLSVVLILFMVGCGGEGHPEIDAFVCAKEVVSNDLKSPNSAVFCSYSSATITSSGDEYTVSGYVDADNSFGASIRTDFTVTLTLTDSGYKDAYAVYD